MSRRTRRTVMAAAGSAGLAAVAGCSFSFQADTSGGRLDVLSAYRNGEDRIETGRSEFRAGTDAARADEYGRAGEAYAAAEAAFADAGTHFEESVTRIDEIDRERGRDICVEAVETAALYESSAATLVEAMAATRAGDAEEARTLTDQARADLSAAQEQGITDSSGLETALGLGEDGQRGP